MKKIFISLSACLFITLASIGQNPDAGATTDLSKKLSKMKLHDGANKIKKMHGGFVLFVDSNNDTIGDYYVLNKKTGTKYTAVSSTPVQPDANTPSLMKSSGGPRLCRIRISIDGRIIDWTVICSRKNR